MRRTLVRNSVQRARCNGCVQTVRRMPGVAGRQAQERMRLGAHEALVLTQLRSWMGRVQYSAPPVLLTAAISINIPFRLTGISVAAASQHCIATSGALICFV